MVYRLAHGLTRSRDHPARRSEAASAELKPDQRDQDTLPPRILDPILELYVEHQLSVARSSPAAGRRRSAGSRRKVDFNEYKRAQACPARSPPPSGSDAGCLIIAAGSASSVAAMASYAAKAVRLRSMSPTLRAAWLLSCSLSAAVDGTAARPACVAQTLQPCPHRKILLPRARSGSHSRRLRTPAASSARPLRHRTRAQERDHRGRTEHLRPARAAHCRVRRRDLYRGSRQCERTFVDGRPAGMTRIRRMRSVSRRACSASSAPVCRRQSSTTCPRASCASSATNTARSSCKAARARFAKPATLRSGASSP